VSYNEKHNQANGENNQDGESHNRSWNCGVEGRTDNAEILALRARQQRNLLATLMVSQGVPMLVHGDESGRSQEGNNNAYCQDNELTWVNWDHVDKPLSEFVAVLSRLRRQHPTFRRNRFFSGRPIEREQGQPLPDIVWLNPDGAPMLPSDWGQPLARALGVFYNGASIGKDWRGRPITDVNFLLCFNSHDRPVTFTLPPDEYSPQWEVALDTAGTIVGTATVAAGTNLEVADKSVLILRAHTAPLEEPDHSVAASLAALAAGPDEGDRSAVQAEQEDHDQG
jgi:isoamylase